MSKRLSQGYLNLRDPPLDPKIAALTGPLEDKIPGSEVWLIQITHKAQGIWVSLECDTKRWREVVQEIDVERPWETYPRDKPYGTRDAFYRAELGAPEPMLTRLKEAQQLMQHGGDHKSEAFQLSVQGGVSKNQAGNTSLISIGKRNDSGYIRARLERDGHTDLLAKVERGEMSAHRAAVTLEWRHPRVTVEPTVEAFVRAACKHFSDEQYDTLIEQLIQHRRRSPYGGR